MYILRSTDSAVVNFKRYDLEGWLVKEVKRMVITLGKQLKKTKTNAKRNKEVNHIYNNWVQ